MSIHSIWISCSGGNQIPATEDGLALLRSLVSGGSPVSPLNCYPVGSVYTGTANPNTWCGGTWTEAANHKSWTRTA